MEIIKKDNYIFVIEKMKMDINGNKRFKVNVFEDTVHIKKYTTQAYNAEMAVNKYKGINKMNKLHTNDVALPFRFTHLIGQFIACDYITDIYGNGILESSDNLDDLLYKYEDNEDVYFYYVGSEGIVYAPIFA